jgi:putative ABC transport system permease protein
LNITNNLKLFFRFVQKHKSHYFLNVGALTICVAVFMFLFSYIDYERNFDSFHLHKDRIFRLINVRHYPNKIDESAGCLEVTGIEMKASFPEVEDYAHCIRRGQIVFVKGKEYKEPDVIYATPSFLKIFSFPVIRGGQSDFLSAPFTCLISESLAKKYFGDEDPVGKQLDFVYEKPVEIEGVFKDLPHQTYFNFNILVSYMTIHSLGYCPDCNNKNTFILLKEKAKKEGIMAKLPGFISRVHPNDEFKREYLLQPLDELYLTNNYRFEIGKTSNGNIFIYLGLVALLVLFIGWFNYINLNTITSFQRIKENGVNTLLGASEGSIFRKYFTESIITAIIVGGLVLMIAINLQPVLCHALDIARFSLSDKTITVLIVSLMVGALTTSFFPYLVFKKSVRGKINTLFKLNKNKSGFSRTAFIVVQGIITVFLIAFSLFTYKQYKFMANNELGFNSNNLLVVNNYFIQTSQEDAAKVFLDNLLQYPQIEKAGFASYLPGSENGDVGGGFRLEGQRPEESVQMYEETVSGNYFDLLSIPLLVGNDFNKNCSESGFPELGLKNKIIVNEAAVKQFGFSRNEDILGKNIIREDRLLGTVQGVVKDYHQRALDSPILPTFYQSRQQPHYFLVKVKPGEIKSTLAIIKKEYKKLSPSGILECYFLDDHFEKQYLSYSNFLKVIILFTVLAISICTIGVFSLIKYIIYIRTKEFGVRKVNGAKTVEIFNVLILDIIKLFSIGYIIAAPIAWFAINKWLEGFAYKTSLSWWIFALTGLFAMVIALLTVSLQSWRTARRNPVETLRYE